MLVQDLRMTTYVRADMYMGSVSHMDCGTEDTSVIWFLAWDLSRVPSLVSTWCIISKYV